MSELIHFFIPSPLTNKFDAVWNKKNPRVFAWIFCLMWDILDSNQ